MQTERSALTNVRPDRRVRRQRRRVGLWLQDILALLFALPLLLVALLIIVAAFTPQNLLNRGVILRAWTLDNIRLALQSAPFVLLYRNTFIYTFGLLFAQIGRAHV